MAAFRDTNGRIWEMRVTPAAMKRVNTLVGVNLGRVLEDNMKPLADLVSDPIQLVDVVYCLCKPEADKLGITDESFGESMVGDVFESMVNAFLEALTDFFPSRQGRLLKSLLAKMQSHQQQMMQEAEEKIDQLISTDFVSSLPESAA